MTAMHMQMTRLWQNMEIYAIGRWKWKKEWGVVRGMVNNNNWQNKVNIIEFLRTLGTGTRVGPLLGRDT